MATGMVAGINAARLAEGRLPTPPPRDSATGSLLHYLANGPLENYQPANTTFALLPPLVPEERRQLRRKADRHRVQVERGLAAFESWLVSLDEGHLSAAP